jgi:hypothetical protein
MGKEQALKQLELMLHPSVSAISPRDFRERKPKARALVTWLSNPWVAVM